MIYEDKNLRNNQSVNVDGLKERNVNRNLFSFLKIWENRLFHSWNQDIHRFLWISTLQLKG